MVVGNPIVEMKGDNIALEESVEHTMRMELNVVVVVQNTQDSVEDIGMADRVAGYNEYGKQGVEKEEVDNSLEELRASFVISA